MEWVAGLIVVLFGFLLCGMSLLIFLRPEAAEGFFNTFASSIQAHFSEQIVRLVVGMALMMFAPSMTWPSVFNGLGLLIAVTAIALMLTPWRIHQRFAIWVMPIVYQYFKIFAGAAFALGLLVLFGWLGAVVN
jgi:hypothetical protein